MNFNLIFKLSLFGLAMALGTVYVIPSSIEPLFWLVIFVTCAIIIAKRCAARHFLHGFLTSLVNCFWITSAHILLIESYLPRHPQEAAMMSNSPFHDSPRLMMLMTGPVIGIVSGLVLGLFALVASRFVKNAVAVAG
jgi:hypothetical protein